MRLHDLLGDTDVLERVGDPLVEVRAIAHDSRRVAPGALFCCIAGARADGHDHAAEAVRAGAAALLVERVLDIDVPQARVPSVRAALGPVAAAFHRWPSSSLRVLGVTGTNGKTTVTYLLEAIARAAGEVTAVLGTTGVRIGDDPAPLALTTPEAPELQCWLARMRDRGVGTVAMEVSSHALAMRRADGTRLAAVCFTNLSPEHLDLHGSLEEYFAAKSRLFTPRFAPVGVVNAADPFGRRLLDVAPIPIRAFALDADASVAARVLELHRRGTTFVLEVRDPEAVTSTVRLPLVGRFNVENALAAAATALSAGFPFDAVVSGLESPVVIPGRMERVDRGQPFAVLVDYAHTPDALATVIETARGVASGHRVILVFGCGGDRDVAKRPAMGAAAAAADLAVLTSDNPRSEAPAAIAAAAETGLRERGGRYLVELDRREAIRAAMTAATDGDVVLIAGKGHETGQTEGAVTRPFDDRVVALEELEALAWT